MTDINTSYNRADRYGRAAFEQLDTFTQSVLLAGAEPPLMPAMAVLLGDNLTLAQFTVVGFATDGRLVPATYNAVPANAIKPCGVLAHAATSAAANTTVRGQVWFSGVFAIEGPLVWDATFDTAAKKSAAFMGAPTPTQILVRHRLTPAS